MNIKIIVRNIRLYVREYKRFLGRNTYFLQSVRTGISIIARCYVWTLLCLQLILLFDEIILINRQQSRIRRNLNKNSNSIIYLINYNRRWNNHLPLTCTSHMASQRPHNPDIKKNIRFCSGVGFQRNRKIKIPAWRKKANIIRGLLPVSFIIEPVPNAAIAFVTPKHIIT